ncbi:hypothetical protein, partial [Nitrosomonas sp.]|uniref:hypothetical protein n=1 Tax=Nitrosomonas sp. TaxID=42353 RepID=UPI0027313E2F
MAARSNPSIDQVLFFAQISADIIQRNIEFRRESKSRAVFQFERSAMATAAATIASRKSSLLFFILILNRVLTRWRHAMPFSLY